MRCPSCMHTRTTCAPRVTLPACRACKYCTPPCLPSLWHACNIDVGLGAQSTHLRLLLAGALCG